MLICSLSLFAQLPRGFSYQAVARDAGSQVLADKDLTAKFSILTESGIIRWQEQRQVTTNEFGLFSVVICENDAHRIGGTATHPGDIQWSADQLLLKIEIDDGSGFEHMGTHPFSAVPYALFALQVAGNGVDNDTDPTNELQDLQLTGNELTITGNASATPIDLAAYNQSNVGWTRNGNQVVYVSGNVGVGTVSPEGRLSIQEVVENEQEPLFLVARKDGYPVFAVYSDGVYAYTDTASSAKGIKGGFAVGGYTSGKKGITDEYMRVNADSIRFYVDRDPEQKGIKGGFAVGGYTSGKGPESEFFRVSGATAATIIDPSEPRILWYPNKEAFLTGRVLIEHPDSVGTNSISTGFESKSIGNYSQAFGYKSVARGDYTTGIGVSSEANGKYSVAIGSHSRSFDQSSFAFGEAAEAQGYKSYAIGYDCEAVGDKSYCLGSQNRAYGEVSYAIGHAARAYENSSMALGRNSRAEGYHSIAIGVSDDAFGEKTTAIGSKSIAMGTGSFSRQAYSYTYGYYLDNSDTYSVVLGKYNVPVSSGTSLIVGNGTSAAARSNAMVVYDNGNVTIAGDLSQNSDLRLKTDIETLGSLKNKISMLRPVRFNFKDRSPGSEYKEVGLIAQEVQEIFPELVKEDAQGVLSLSYSKLSVLLIKAYQEQQAELNKKEAEIRVLREEIQGIKEHLGL